MQAELISDYLIFWFFGAEDCLEQGYEWQPVEKLLVLKEVDFLFYYTCPVYDSLRRLCIGRYSDRKECIGFTRFFEMIRRAGILRHDLTFEYQIRDLFLVIYFISVLTVVVTRIVGAQPVLLIDALRVKARVDHEVKVYTVAIGESCWIIVHFDFWNIRADPGVVQEFLFQAAFSFYDPIMVKVIASDRAVPLDAYFTIFHLS